MLRPAVFGALLCFIAYQSFYCAAQIVDNSVHTQADVPIPPQKPTTPNGAPNTTTSTTVAPSTTSSTTVAPTTNGTTTTTTTSPSTTNATTPKTTTSTSSPSPPTTTTGSTSTSTSTSSVAPPTSSSTVHPPTPPPSDRKFDAMSFLGGFTLGLGLVAIGILSWKFYLSRQENYYHTL